ncbi:MAG: DNA-3-methyladenine glycosylase [Cyanobacteria bacterium]|nr:DNA-3-methyladenine glycosylase [Cyanobacteriota bacterium]
MATTLSQSLPQFFFCRPADLVAPELVGCLLVKRQSSGALLWGVIVETEAYCQSEPACHGHRRRTPSNETLFGEPGRFYVVVSYGIHHCVNVVCGRSDWASGVLLRAAALPAAPERCAAGPALLARCFDLDRRHDAQPARLEAGLWLAPRPPLLVTWLAPTLATPAAAKESDPRRGASGDGEPILLSPRAANSARSALVQTSRIGISQAQELPWRWYLRASRAVSRRAPGDRRPRCDALADVLAALAPGQPATTVGKPL